MKNKKLNLNELKVKSFVTDFESGTEQTVKGGAAQGSNYKGCNQKTINFKGCEAESTTYTGAPCNSQPPTACSNSLPYCW